MHKKFLLAALQQAWLGRGICAPNPSVGAIAVVDGKIIAQAFHLGAGTAHAEQLLLSRLPAGLNNVTLYVTLEPCNHWGKTPPCVEAIIAYGIKKVVYGFADPNPLVAQNDTPGILRRAGIEVIHYPLKEIRDFYACYDYWTRTKKPWITTKIAQSFDGKIAGINGARIQLSNELCNQFTHKNRLHADVILTTVNTINNDNPLLNVRLPQKELAKPVAIIDPRGEINSNAHIFSSAKYCHIFHAQGVKTPSRDNCSYYALPSNNGHIDLSTVVEKLGELGFHEVWVEAGASLFNALHESQMVQKTYIYLAPTVVGSESFSLYHNNNWLRFPHKIQWLKFGNNVVASLDWQTGSN